MLINPEVLYSMLICNTVNKNSIDKIKVLSHIYEINNNLLKKQNLIKRISQFKKYQKEKHIIIAELIDIIKKLNTEDIIKQMFTNVIKTGKTEVAEKVYNILIKKWNLVAVNIITPVYNINPVDLRKFTNIARVDYTYNPSIINGNITFINSLKIDNSILGRLNSIYSQLTDM